jgi:hypothetical protein
MCCIDERKEGESMSDDSRNGEMYDCYSLNYKLKISTGKTLRL